MHIIALTANIYTTQQQDLADHMDYIPENICECKIHDPSAKCLGGKKKVRFLACKSTPLNVTVECLAWLPSI